MTKKILISLIAIPIFYGLMIYMTSRVAAGGDKVRGDEGSGAVNMVQNQPCEAWDEWCL